MAVDFSVAREALNRAINECTRAMQRLEEEERAETRAEEILAQHTTQAVDDPASDRVVTLKEPETQNTTTRKADDSKK